MPHLRICYLVLVLCSAVSAAVPAGFYDVTAHGADPTGSSDSTAALQAAINHCRDQRLVVWFPPGTYRVSDRLVIDQPDNDDDFPGVLMGSTVDPDHRAELYLAPSSPGFGNADARRAVVHFLNIGTPETESGNTDLYNQVFAGIDIRIGAGNPGAVGLRMQGAEGCTIQDVRIDLTAGGHTGIWGVPASGGATHTIRIDGGVIGIDTRKIDGSSGGGSQPQPVISGATLINQSGPAVYSSTRGAMVMVGAHILRSSPGPAIILQYHWKGQPYDGSLQLVDSIIDHATADAANTVIAMSDASGDPGRSYHLDNVYVRRAACIHNAANATDANGWSHVRRLAVHIQPHTRSWGQPNEAVWMGGALHGDRFADIANGPTPPVDLVTRHHLPANRPTWETPGVVIATEHGVTGDGVSDDWAALQALIDQHEMIFLPAGEYRVSRTLDLRPASKLIGGGSIFTVISAISTVADRFADATPETGDRPIIRSADSASADTYLGFLHLKRTIPLSPHNPTPPGNYALEWRSGGNSVINHVDVEGRPSDYLRPDFVAQNYYGLDLVPNPNHPQDDFPSGMYPWPCAEATVQIRGNGGGRWFTFWMHGRQGLRDTVPFLRVEGTNEPLVFYHLHMQQQDSLNHGEFINADNVTIFGGKGEIKGTFAYFEHCDNIRMFGHSGMSSPDPDRNPPYLFRFVDCTNMLIAGINDTISESSSNPRRWVGGAYDRWVHSYLLDFSAIHDQHAGGTTTVPNGHRPIVYLRGHPTAGRRLPPRRIAIGAQRDGQWLQLEVSLDDQAGVSSGDSQAVFDELDSGVDHLLELMELPSGGA